MNSLLTHLTRAHILLGGLDDDQIVRIWRVTSSVIGLGSAVSCNLSGTNMSTNEALGGCGNAILNGGTDADLLIGEAGSDVVFGEKAKDNRNSRRSRHNEWRFRAANDAQRRSVA